MEIRLFKVPTEVFERVCNNFIMDTPIIWIKRYESDFMKFDCHDAAKAKENYILMHQVWDREDLFFEV